MALEPVQGGVDNVAHFITVGVDSELNLLLLLLNEYRSCSIRDRSFQYSIAFVAAGALFHLILAK